MDLIMHPSAALRLDRPLLPKTDALPLSLSLSLSVFFQIQQWRRRAAGKSEDFFLSFFFYSFLLQIETIEIFFREIEFLKFEAE